MTACGPLERQVDVTLNRVIEDKDPLSRTPSDAVDDDEFREFYASLFIADLHADTMLWNRDVLVTEGRGHVDLPRMCRGGVDLQVFSTVTKWGPSNEVPCHPESDGSLVGLLSFLHVPDWPMKTVFDLEERANIPAEVLFETVQKSQGAESEGQLTIILTRSDLRALLEGHNSSDGCVVGGVLALEGLHFIGSDPEGGVDRLMDRGFRMASLTHHFDNALAGSSTGCDQSTGLTSGGERTLNRMKETSMVLDLAHASKETIEEVIAWREAVGDTRPFFVSHTGINGFGCTDPRNLDEEDIVRIAKAGGVIGVMYWDKQVCRKGESRERVIEGILAAFRTLHGALEEAGLDPADHMALGSDFDGAIASPFDAAGLDELILRLRSEMVDGGNRRRYSDEDIRKIAGGNACRVPAAALPGNAGSGEEICGSVVQ